MPGYALGTWNVPGNKTGPKLSLRQGELTFERRERDLEISLMPMQTTLYFYKGDYKLSHPWVVVVITGDCTYPAWNTAGV